MPSGPTSGSATAIWCTRKLPGAVPSDSARTRRSRTQDSVRWGAAQLARGASIGGAAVGFAADVSSGTDPVRAGFRTGGAIALGTVGGAVGGTACSPGIVTAAACAGVGGAVGGAFGSTAGDLIYSGADLLHQKIVKPALEPGLPCSIPFQC